MDDAATRLVSEMVRAPAGAALLAYLKSAQRVPSVWSDAHDDVDPAAARAAVAWLAGAPAGEVLAAAVDAALLIAGPWTVGAPVSRWHLSVDPEPGVARLQARSPGRCRNIEKCWLGYFDASLWAWPS